jgi:hypothetical protein
MGAPAACDAFVRRWTELTGRMPELRVRLRQHMLTAVNDVPLASGHPRVAVAADTPWLIEMQIAFIAEVGTRPAGTRGRVHAASRRAQRLLDLGRWWPRRVHVQRRSPGFREDRSGAYGGRAPRPTMRRRLSRTFRASFCPAGSASSS